MLLIHTEYGKPINASFNFKLHLKGKVMRISDESTPGYAKSVHTTKNSFN
jgi:hypothetical protein